MLKIIAIFLLIGNAIKLNLADQFKEEILRQPIETHFEHDYIDEPIEVEPIRKFAQPIPPQPAAPGVIKPKIETRGGGFNEFIIREERRQQFERAERIKKREEIIRQELERRKQEELFRQELEREEKRRRDDFQKRLVEVDVHIQNQRKEQPLKDTNPVNIGANSRKITDVNVERKNEFVTDELRRVQFDRKLPPPLFG